MSKEDAVWRALAASHRRNILRLVRDEEKTAGEVAAAFDISRPAVSQHLTALKDAGLLDERREGTKRLYRVNRRQLGVLSSWLGAMGLAPTAKPRAQAVVPRRPTVRGYELELDTRPAAAWRLLADPQQRARWKGAPEPEVLERVAGESLRWRWRWTESASAAEVEVKVTPNGRACVVNVEHRGVGAERWPAYLERLQVVARGWDPGPEDGFQS